MTMTEDLREKKNKFTATMQDIEAQRETAVQNISQVNLAFSCRDLTRSQVSMQNI